MRHRRARPLRLPLHADAPRATAPSGYFVIRERAARRPAATAWAAAPATNKDEATNYVGDVSAGAEWRFDDDKSIAFFNVNARRDVKGNGDDYYREVSGSYSVTKYITGPFSVELAGRHRYRIQEGENIRGGDVRRRRLGGRASTRPR